VSAIPSEQLRIDHWLARFPAEPPPSGVAGAAVLIVLRPAPPGIEVLLLRRSRRTSDPGSDQVGLPGGRVDARDRSLAETALREFEEETGVSRRAVAEPPAFLGIRPAPRFQLHVGLFATTLREDHELRFVPDAREVAALFWFPIDRLGRTDRVTMPVGSGTIEVDAIPHGEHTLWGFTLRVLQSTLEGLVAPAATAGSPPDGSPPKPRI